MVADPAAEGLIDENWLGDEIGVDRPSFVRRGRVEIAEDGDGVAIPKVVQPGDEVFQHIPEDQVAVINLETGEHYTATFSPGTDRLAEERARRFELDVPTTEDSDAPFAILRSVTGGVDTRTRLGLAQGVGTNNWMSGVGLLNIDGCTGTLISPTSYLTAAHCMYNTAGTVVKRAFTPRADESQGFYNQPWGLWTATQASVPLAYTQNLCNKNYTSNCEQYDIALVKVTPPAGYPVNSYYFQAAAETRAQLLTRALKNRGYPLMNGQGAPAGITNSSTLWGDANSCALGADMYPADPWSPVIFHNCDTSTGHSGGPIFYYPTTGRPVIVGVHIAGDPDLSFNTPNSFKRISSNTMTWINGLL